MAGLTRPDAAKDAAKTYALQVADTVVVQSGGAPPEVVTALVPKGWTDAAYFFNVRAHDLHLSQTLVNPCRLHISEPDPLPNPSLYMILNLDPWFEP